MREKQVDTFQKCFNTFQNVSFLCFGLYGCCSFWACSSETPSKYKKITPLKATVVLRSKESCDAYVKRVCSCAQEHPNDFTLERGCLLAKAYPSALQMHLDILEGVGIDLTGQKVVKAEVTKIAAVCLKKDMQLSLTKCPRP